MSLVFTNGCFDLIHPGHIFFLERAKMCGDRLIVGINSDDSLRRIKGHEPTVPLLDRVRIVKSLRVVDGVASFAEDTPIELVKLYRPDVLVQSREYLSPKTEEAQYVKSYGGKVVYVERIPRWSSTDLRRSLCA